MPKYKVTKVYVVDAETKIAALQRVREGKAEEQLDYESAKDVTPPTRSWLQSAARQVSGREF